MNNPREFIELKTFGSTELRTDPSTNEQYEEEVILVRDKRLKTTFDIDTISSIDEYVDETGTIIKDRVIISDTYGVQRILLMTYEEIVEIINNTNSRNKIGFHGHKKERKEDSNKV